MPLMVVAVFSLKNGNIGRFTELLWLDCGKTAWAGTTRFGFIAMKIPWGFPQVD